MILSPQTKTHLEGQVAYFREESAREGRDYKRVQAQANSHRHASDELTKRAEEIQALLEREDA